MAWMLVLRKMSAVVVLGLVVGIQLAANAFAQTAQSESRRQRGEASPICLWMFLVESQEYRQRCGPMVDDAAQQRARQALEIFDAYFKEHGVPAGANAEYLAHMRGNWDAGKHYRCDHPDLGPLPKLFDHFTSAESVSKLADELRQASGPNDGTCL